MQVTNKKVIRFAVNCWLLDIFSPMLISSMAIHRLIVVYFWITLGTSKSCLDVVWFSPDWCKFLLPVISSFGFVRQRINTIWSLWLRWWRCCLWLSNPSLRPSWKSRISGLPWVVRNWYVFFVTANRIICQASPPPTVFCSAWIRTFSSMIWLVGIPSCLYCFVGGWSVMP